MLLESLTDLVEVGSNEDLEDFVPCSLLTNSYENASLNRDKDFNEKDIKEVEIRIIGEVISFTYDIHLKSWIHNVKITFNKPLKDADYLLSMCSYESLDLSYFNTEFITNFSYVLCLL